MPSRHFALYDTETTGLDNDYDQVLEAAMLTLDENFDPVAGSEKVLSVRPRVDVPPHPGACLTHGLNLADLRQRGMSEYEFARQFLAYMGSPGTYIGGYNSIAYDDEVIRRLLFRNLQDPYGHEWRDGDHRFDVLTLARTLYAWDPETLNWPTDEDGGVTMALAKLAPANNIIHENAHDALSDVKATAELLQLIRNLGTPWLERYMGLTDKRAVEKMMARKAPLFHVSPFYTKERCYSSLILPVVRDSEVNNKVLCVDLAEDPTELLKMSAEEIRHYRFTPRSELEENPPATPVTSVSINKSPSLAQADQVPGSLHGRMGIDFKQCIEHARMITSDKDFASRLQRAFKVDLPEPSDTYGTIYSGGFFSRADTARRDRVHASDANRMPAIATQKASALMKDAEDPRLHELALRLQGINFPSALADPQDHDRFLDYLQRRLYEQDGPGLSLEESREAIDLCRLDRVLSEDEEAILDDLSSHLDWIEDEAGRIRTRSMVLAEGEAAYPVAARERKPSAPDDEARPEEESSPRKEAEQKSRRRSSPFPASLVRGKGQDRKPEPSSEGAPDPCPF